MYKKEDLQTLRLRYGKRCENFLAARDFKKYEDDKMYLLFCTTNLTSVHDVTKQTKVMLYI